jgi:hypothetical protein
MDFGDGKFAQDAQSIRNSLVFLDVLALDVRYQEHVRASKALYLVWMASAIERFWKSYLTELCSRVACSPLSKRRRHLASAGIFYFDALSSLGEGKKLKRWARVADFFTDLPVIGSSALSIPHDGRTIRPDHFDLVWRIFSLPGNQFPSPIHKQVLNTLADQRNDVAHGLIDIHSVGGTVTVNDLRVLINRLEDIVLNSVICASNKWP